jgi:CsoR family transcriptional regulator, copper-sensing transcriptional repressor
VVNSEHKRDALVRLKTVRGHLDGIIRMVEAEAYCPELMKQVAAAQASLERVNRILLQNHLETCVTEAIQSGEGSAKIAELIQALRFNGGLTDFRERAEPLASPCLTGSDPSEPSGRAALTARKREKPAP